jgi:hypothetical protein
LLSSWDHLLRIENANGVPNPGTCEKAEKKGKSRKLARGVACEAAELSADAEIPARAGRLGDIRREVVSPIIAMLSGVAEDGVIVTTPGSPYRFDGN